MAVFRQLLPLPLLPPVKLIDSSLAPEAESALTVSVPTCVSLAEIVASDER